MFSSNVETSSLMVILMTLTITWPTRTDGLELAKDARECRKLINSVQSFYYPLVLGCCKLGRYSAFMWIDTPLFDRSAVGLEGVDRALDTLIDAGIRGIVLGPTWTAEIVETPEQGRSYGPFTDNVFRESLRVNIGAKPVYARWFHAFKPDKRLYHFTRLKPYRGPDTGSKPDIFSEIVRSSKEKGIRVLLLVEGATPVVFLNPPEGSVMMKDVLGNEMGYNCPNDPEFPEYMEAYMRDSYENYPEIDGFMVDHLEFPSYTISEIFACFCEGCREKASALGYSFEALKSGARRAYKRLAHLTQNQVAAISIARRGMLDSFAVLAADRELSDWIRFKVESLNAVFESIRRSVNDIDIKLELNIDCVTASFALLSGVDLGNLRGYADFVNPKLYSTPDFWSWRGRISEYVKTLTKLNLELSEEAALRFLYIVFGMELLSSEKTLEETVDTKSPQKVLSEIQKNAAFLGDKSKLRPWIRLDIEMEELDNLLGALVKTGIEGVLIRSYEVATEEKLESIHKFIGS